MIKIRFETLAIRFDSIQDLKRFDLAVDKITNRISAHIGWQIKINNKTCTLAIQGN